MNDRTEAAVGPSGLSLLSPKIYFFKESEIIFALRASNVVMSTSAEVVSVLVFFEAEEAALESARLMRHYLFSFPPPPPPPPPGEVVVGEGGIGEVGAA